MASCLIMIHIPGSEKKTFFFTRRSCSVPKISATEQNCGYDPIPEELLVRMVNRKSLEENSPFFPSNDGKNVNKNIMH